MKFRCPLYDAGHTGPVSAVQRCARCMSRCNEGAAGGRNGVISTVHTAGFYLVFIYTTLLHWYDATLKLTETSHIVRGLSDCIHTRTHVHQMPVDALTAHKSVVQILSYIDDTTNNMKTVSP